MSPEDQQQKIKEMREESQALLDKLTPEEREIAEEMLAESRIEKPRQKFCTNCGAPVSGGKFCTNCGHPLLNS